MVALETWKERWESIFSPANPVWLFVPLSGRGHVLWLLSVTYDGWPLSSSRRGLWFLAPEVLGSVGPKHGSKGQCITIAVPSHSALKPWFSHWGAGSHGWHGHASREARVVSPRWFGLVQKGHAHLGGGDKGDSQNPTALGRTAGALTLGLSFPPHPHPSLGGSRAPAVSPRVAAVVQE